MAVQDVDNRSYLEKLSSGLLMLGIKRSIDEAAYYVIDQQTFGHVALNTRHTYSSEVARVLDDLALSVGLEKDIKNAMTVNGRVYQPEELVAYYNGALYTLTHSLKDKIIQLLAVMFSEDQLPKAYKDLESAKVKKFLDNNTVLLKQIGIYELLEEWLDSASGVIGKTLRRRNDYHHYQNKQQLNKDLQNLKAARLMQQPNHIDQLTEYGKDKMLSLEKDSLNNILKVNADFQAEVLKAVTTNVEELAHHLIDYYKIPTDQLELTRIGASYTEFLASLRIENKTSKDKIQPEVQEMLAVFMEDVNKDTKVKPVAIYLVGSCARGDFIPGSSDINFYVITESYSRTFDSEMPVTLTILSEKDLMSAEHKKDRFIIWSDGLLMQGKQYDFKNEKFPKPGIALCLLLNKGILEKLESLQTELESLVRPTNLELRLFSLKAAKIMMDYDYGLAMSNRPLYTASRKGKIAHTKVEFPDGRRTAILERIYYGGVMKQSDLKLLIDAFLENARSSYEHLLKLEQETLKLPESA